MIHKYEFFHGAALTRLIHGAKGNISIDNYECKSFNAAYILDVSVGLYIKHSTNRLSPWVFTFHKDHQDDIREMNEKLKTVFVALICNDDGIVCLSFEELKSALDDNHDPTEWVRISRRSRQQ